MCIGLRTGQRVAAALFAGLILLSSPSSSFAEGTRSTGRLERLQREERQLQRQERQEESRESYWRARHQTLLARKAAAEASVDDALENYKFQRHIRRRRGRRRPEATARLNKAKADLVVAEAELETFYEEVRRAGIPPGWIRADL